MERKPCNPSPECKYFYTEPKARDGFEDSGCFEDIDHTFYPKRDYQTPVEKRFRRLPENLVQTCRRLHDDRHAMEAPPVKPTPEAMLKAIGESALNLIRDKNETTIEQVE